MTGIQVTIRGAILHTQWRVNITRALKQYGWCARIRGVESGGAAEDLPVLADCRGMEWDTG